MPTTGSFEVFEKDCPKLLRTLAVYDYWTAHEKSLMGMGHG